MKPEYIAPIVAYLCHESCDTTGSLFELGAGWVSKIRWQRSQGVSFPLNQPFTAENVKERFHDIISFDENATYPTSGNDSFSAVMGNLETLKAKL